MSSLLQILIVLTLAAHLICMNVCSAGPLLTIWLERRFRRTGDPIANQIGLRLTRTILATFIVGIGFGFFLAGLIWLSGNRDFFAALPAFAHKIWWGIWELVAYFVAMLLYWKLWPSKTTSVIQSYFHRFIAIFAATNLLYHFPPLFTAIANHGNAAPTKITPADFRQIIFSHEVMSISVHFWLASFAVTGVAVMILGRRELRREPSIRWPVTSGAMVALIVTALQFLVGMWIALKLPAQSQQAVMGGNLIATGCLILSIGLSFDLVNRLSSIAFGDFTDKSLLLAVGNMTAIVVFMSATLWLAQH